MDTAARLALLRVARTSLCAGPVGETRDAGQGSPSGGVFVSLHRIGPGHKELRGCMGTLACDDGLSAAVARAAVSAATGDPRFPPLVPDEAGDVEIEISILSPFESVAQAECVEVGRHGVCVSRGGRRALLLPQVAVEHGWDRDTFLAHACLKAGLDAKAWRDPSTRIEVFTAEVFGEEPAERPPTATSG